MNGCVFRILKTLQFEGPGKDGELKEGSKSAVPWSILWTGLALWLHYIRTAGEVKLTKTITAVEATIEEKFIDPKDFPQWEGIQNVVGIVVGMGELVKTSNQIPKRLVSLQFADYEFGIEFVGAIASCPPRIGDEILVVSVTMVMYINIPSLEASRLSYWRKLKTMTVRKMEGEERPSKALKCDIPEVTVATLDSAPAQPCFWSASCLLSHPRTW